jgi:hypothetical protein
LPFGRLADPIVGAGRLSRPSAVGETAALSGLPPPTWGTGFGGGPLSGTAGAIVRSADPKGAAGPAPDAGDWAKAGPDAINDRQTRNAGFMAGRSSR